MLHVVMWKVRYPAQKPYQPGMASVLISHQIITPFVSSHDYVPPCYESMLAQLQYGQPDERFNEKFQTPKVRSF